MKKVSEKYHLIIFEYALNSMCKQNVNKNDSKCMYLFGYKMSAILYRGHDNSSKINNDLKQRGQNRN